MSGCPFLIVPTKGGSAMKSKRKRPVLKSERSLAPPPLKFEQPPNITEGEYGGLQDAFEFFNDRLFARALPSRHCVFVCSGSLAIL
jgi:hypothetical protein